MITVLIDENVNPNFSSSPVQCELCIKTRIYRYLLNFSRDFFQRKFSEELLKYFDLYTFLSVYKL